MQVHVIRTPTDFRRAMGGLSYSRHEIIPPAYEAMEPDIRRTMDDIFTDLEYVGGDAGLTSAYLEGIAEPLRQLRDWGFQLTATVTTGTLTFGDPPQRIPWSSTLYVLAPAGTFFQAEGAGLVHLLGADCDDAGRELTAGEDRAFRYWSSRDALEQAFEGRVPMCPRCALAAVSE
jgi:hypothetical protein